MTNDADRIIAFLAESIGVDLIPWQENWLRQWINEGMPDITIAQPRSHQHRNAEAAAELFNAWQESGQSIPDFVKTHTASGVVDAARQNGKTTAWAVAGNPKAHAFKTNGFPYETCLVCGYGKDDHGTDR